MLLPQVCRTRLHRPREKHRRCKAASVAQGWAAAAVAAAAAAKTAAEAAAAAAAAEVAGAAATAAAAAAAQAAGAATAVPAEAPAKAVPAEAAAAALESAAEAATAAAAAAVAAEAAAEGEEAAVAGAAAPATTAAAAPAAAAAAAPAAGAGAEAGESAALSEEGPAPLSTSQRIDRGYSTMDLHAEALNEIERLLPVGHLARTFRGCKADFGYQVEKADGLLPIQVKGSRVGKQGGVFHNPSRCGGDIQVLLLGRPLPNRQQTLVLPESMVLQGGVWLTLDSKTASKYDSYLVSDDLLAEVLEGIYDGVRAGRSSFTLPSDEVIDISLLELKTISELSLPTGLNDRKAWGYFQLRNQWLPEIEFQSDSTVPSPVSVVVEGVRVNDKVARDCVNGKLVICRINLSRRRGSPYEEGDFDALWVYHPDMVHFWLIPAHVLVERGFLATPQQPGKKGLLLYDQSYVKPARRNGRAADLWSQKYLYSSQDPRLPAKVLEALKAVKA